MKAVTFDDIRAMKGNGSTMRTVLKWFTDKGATVTLLSEEIGSVTERYFLVNYQGLGIPLRAYNLNFYSVFNSAFAQRVTSDKLKTYHFLKTFDFPTPETILYSELDDPEGFISQYGKIVAKPRDGAHGDGITTAIQDAQTLEQAVGRAKEVHPDVLIQQEVTGEDYRLLFIDYEFVAAVKRVPAAVIGDGSSTVRQLVGTSNAEKDQLWADIRNGSGSADKTPGSVSKTPLEEVIAAKGAEFLEKVPSKDEILQVVDKANVSLGGQTVDVTDLVNRKLTSKMTDLLKKLDLPLCGVDVLSTDISAPLDNKESYVIELNSAPGLRLHELPAQGQPRQVCGMVAESLIRHYQTIAKQEEK